MKRLLIAAGVGGRGTLAVSRPGQRQHARGVPRPAARLRERRRPVADLREPGGPAGAPDRRGRHLPGVAPSGSSGYNSAMRPDHQRPERARPVHGGLPGQPAAALRRLQQGDAARPRRRGHRDPGGRAAPGGPEHLRGADGVRDRCEAEQAPARHAARRRRGQRALACAAQRPDRRRGHRRCWPCSAVLPHRAAHPQAPAAGTQGGQGGRPGRPDRAQRRA